MVTLPATMELRDFQTEGIAWLQDKKRGMLLDEPGLGKTMQAILAATTPVLVACPGYLVTQWRDEIIRLRPDDTIAMGVGTRWDRIEHIGLNRDWTIVNIEMLRTYEFPHKYETFVIDESHHVKGHSAKQSRNARQLGKRIPNVFLLTATPIKRECDDLFMQLSILDPKRFSVYDAFLAQYCKTFDNGFKVQVVGPRNPQEMRELLGEYSIRRTYESTGLKRNEPINQMVLIQASPSWRKVYKELKEKFRLFDLTFESSVEVARTLRRLTLDLKIVSAKAILEDNQRTIFYVYYRESAYQLGEQLKLPVITGDMPPAQRAALAKSSKHGLVATIKSLSEGIDLTHFSNLVYIETSYIPGDLTQTTARLVRWNLNIRPVRIFHVQVKSTIDTAIHAVIMRRDGDERSIVQQELTREDDEDDEQL